MYISIRIFLVPSVHLSGGHPQVCIGITQTCFSWICTSFCFQTNLIFFYCNENKFKRPSLRASLDMDFCRTSGGIGHSAWGLTTRVNKHTSLVISQCAGLPEPAKARIHYMCTHTEWDHTTTVELSSDKAARVDQSYFFQTETGLKRTMLHGRSTVGGYFHHVRLKGV